MSTLSVHSTHEYILINLDFPCLDTDSILRFQDWLFTLPTFPHRPRHATFHILQVIQLKRLWILLHEIITPTRCRRRPCPSFWREPQCISSAMIDPTQKRSHRWNRSNDNSDIQLNHIPEWEIGKFPRYVICFSELVGLADLDHGTDCSEETQTEEKRETNFVSCRKTEVPHKDKWEDHISYI